MVSFGINYSLSRTIGAVVSIQRNKVMSIIHQFFKLNLRRLILALAVVSALTASLSSSYFYHAVQSHALIHNTLSHNLSYAIKIAEWIDVFFRATIQQLSYSATILSKHRHNLAILNQESERIFTQTDSLNYVYITNQSGEILSVYPDDKSIKLASVIRNYEQSQDGKKPLITKPYMGATGKLQVDLLYPIYLEDQCVGYIGGVILLGEKNILAQVINQNYSNDGSYPYAVDQTNRLIFNANGGMLNEDMSLNNAVRAANKEKSGSLQFVDLDGFEMLAGYARSQYTGWKVVYQRSLQETLQEANSSMLATLYYSLLFSIFGFMLIYIAAYFISKPLLQLAKNTKKHPRQSRCDKVEKIKAWYFEAAQLKCAILARTKEFK